jgi:hypothetical protein
VPSSKANALAQPSELTILDPAAYQHVRQNRVEKQLGRLIRLGVIRTLSELDAVL